MRNRIVDSTWLGRGRHVLLKQVLTCQTTSKRDPFSSTLLPLSRLFLAYSSIHTLARSSFHSLDRPLTRSLVHSHFVPPNRLFTYPHTRISGLSLARSFTPYSISPISSLSLYIYIFLTSSTNLLVPDLFPFSPVPKASTRRYILRVFAPHSYACARSPSGPYYPHSATENQPFPHSRVSLCPVASPNLAPHPGQRNCMSKCQRHSVQLLTARTVNDRRRRPSSSCRRRIESRFYHALLLINVCG